MSRLVASQAAPCPTQDDLDGLNMLYPVCGDIRQTEPLCSKSHENLGLLRLFTSVRRLPSHRAIPAGQRTSIGMFPSSRTGCLFYAEMT